MDRNNKLYIFPSGNKYDSEEIVKAVAESNFDNVKSEDKATLKALHDLYWKAQSNS